MFGYGSAMPTGIELIAAERERQIAELGYDADHDAQHEGEDLAFAAACYAAPDAIYLVRVELNGVRWVMPWPSDWGAPPERDFGRASYERRVDECTKAGALMAAEIDRLQDEEEHGEA